MDNQVLDEDFSNQEKPKLRHADFGIRLGALLIDNLILLPLIMLHFWNMIVLKSLLLSVLVILLTILYKPFYEHFYKATLGKKLLGLQVLSDEYEQISIEQSFLRSAPWVITSLLGLSTYVAIFNAEEFQSADNMIKVAELLEQYSGLGDQFASWMIIISCLFVLFNEQKLALHDQLAKTVVIYQK